MHLVGDGRNTDQVSSGQIGKYFGQSLAWEVLQGHDEDVWSVDGRKEKKREERL